MADFTQTRSPLFSSDASYHLSESALSHSAQYEPDNLNAAEPAVNRPVHAADSASVTNTSSPAISQYLVAPERGRSLPRRHYHLPPNLSPSSATQNRPPRPSSVAHATNSNLTRQSDEDNYSDQKSWQSNSPTLAPSPRESFDDEPQYYYQDQDQSYPSSHHKSMEFPNSPRGAPAAAAYPSNRGNGIPAVPLINNIKNEWQRSASHIRNKSSDLYSDRDAPRIGAILRRAVRRRGCAYFLGFVVFLVVMLNVVGSPMGERSRLRDSLRSRLNEEKGYFGVNQRVGFLNMHQVAEIERWKVPGSGESKDGQTANERRLIVVGDIHGCMEELRALMEKIKYDHKKDHLVTAGDMISRGPESPAVLDYLMDNKASCVRGNHEDRVLLAHRDLNSPSHRKTTYSSDGSVSHKAIKKGTASDLDLAGILTKEQIEYLETCPLILDLGDIPGMGPTSVVHAGLVPAVALNKQDPGAVMSMRSIDLRSHVPSKNPAPKGHAYTEKKDRDKLGRSYIVPWTSLWNTYQDMIDKKMRSSVIYGHNAKRGIMKEDWTWGIDGNCVRGGQLAAVVISSVGGSVKKELVTVDCVDHTVQEAKEENLGDQ